MKNLMVLGLLGFATAVTPAVAAESKSAKEALEKGKACFDKKDYDGAVAAYSAAIRLDPKDAGVYCNRGNAYNAKGDHDKAIADYTVAIRLDPQMASAYLARAFAYEAKGDSDKQIDDLARPFASTRNRQPRTTSGPRHTGGKGTLKRRQRIIARSYA